MTLSRKAVNRRLLEAREALTVARAAEATELEQLVQKIKRRATGSQHNLLRELATKLTHCEKSELRALGKLMEDAFR